MNSFTENNHIITEVMKLKNYLKDQTSPYLLQHADNPVNWYPWCKEAFDKAKEENKPIFLSIGYSTCHWCHVMAHESFEDEEVAEELNRHFISIKVDKEERPDIDSIYMSVCMMFTGNGGWPTSIFMTPEQKPFYAGTYFPKNAPYGSIGFLALLKIIHKKWEENEDSLIKTGEEITRELQWYTEETKQFAKGQGNQKIDEKLQEQAFWWFWNNFDRKYGGFGMAPKFPSPHNLLFLMEYYDVTGEETALEMAEKTLLQMYKGGIFDHIGYGFSRYSTDNYFLVPHFEKMLYDNALLLLAYTRAFSITRKDIYQNVAEKTADYILREMTSPEGGFYSAQDADSEGVEGRYYVFDYWEIIDLLGEEKGKSFNEYYNITRQGNFEGKNIPNRLKESQDVEKEQEFKECKEKVYAYRKERCKLHLDDKILTSWNGLMIGAFAVMYRVFGKDIYLQQAKAAYDFLERNQQEEGVLFVSYREGKCQGNGFLDDYAFYVFALLNLYQATLEKRYLEKAIRYCKKTITDFGDREQGGFYLYGKENEQLIVTPKETYDGAIPSGNSVMAYNLVKLWNLLLEDEWQEEAKRQLKFLALCAGEDEEIADTANGNGKAAAQSFFLVALSMYQNPPEHIVCVWKDKSDLEKLKDKIKQGADILVYEKETENYPKINDKTTLYICKDYSCLPPVNLS